MSHKMSREAYTQQAWEKVTRPIGRIHDVRFRNQTVQSREEYYGRTLYLHDTDLLTFHQVLAQDPAWAKASPRIIYLEDHLPCQDGILRRGPFDSSSVTLQQIAEFIECNKPSDWLAESNDFKNACHRYIDTVYRLFVRHCVIQTLVFPYHVDAKFGYNF